MSIGSALQELPVEFWRAVVRSGVGLSEHLLVARIHQQSLFHFQAILAASCDDLPAYILQRNFLISTSRFGIGQVEGSNCTPLGLHQIVEKIGSGWPAGTVFKGREPIGFTWKGMPDAKITTRILWLDGLEPGLNRGGNVDSHKRYIYIHGVGDETTIGRPASCGCIHLASTDLVRLFDQVPAGTLVWIEE